MTSLACSVSCAECWAQDGHEVTTASDGIEGLRRACCEDWDLVVLDLLLPELPGTTVLTALLDRKPTQKVIVLSAVGDTASRVACLERGAVDYVGKPFAIRELRARVQSRLRDPAPAPLHDKLLGPGIRLDLVRRELRYHGRTVALTPREFLVLQHLMNSPGGVSSRQELLSEVWGYAFDPGSNVVDVTVARLRAKLGIDLISTVRHVGYALAAG